MKTMSTEQQTSGSLTDKQQLQHEKRPLLKVGKSQTGKKWTTSQLIFIIVITVLLTNVMSNIDRLIDVFSNDNSSSSFVPKSFGHEMYDYFDFDGKDTVNFNWGSFGGYPKSIITDVSSLQHTIQEGINYYQMQVRTYDQMDVLQRFADYMGIDNWIDLVFIDNASHGVNAIIRSLSQFLYSNTCNNNVNPTKICKILSFNTAYPMIPEALNWINENVNSPQNQLLTFDFTNAMLDDTDLLIESLNEFIQNEYIQSGNMTIIYMAILSHITGFPAVLLDCKSIIEQVFKPNNIISVIDGAHSLGQVKLDISDMDPDVFIATGYKWFHAPRGSGLLYVRSSLQYLIEPTVTSNLGGGPTTFQSKFSYVGTKDYTPWIAMNYSLNWRRQVVTNNNDDEIIEYIHNLAVEGGQLIAGLWNTSLLIINEERIAAMSNIILPTQIPSEVAYINNTLLLFDSYRLVSRIEIDSDGIYSARLCAQIFLQLSDYEYFAGRVIEILHEMRSY